MTEDRIIYIVVPIGEELRETNQSDSRKTGKTPLINRDNLKVGKALSKQNRIKGYQKDVGNVEFHEILNDFTLSRSELQELETRIKRRLDKHRVRNPHTNYKTEWLYGIEFEALKKVILEEHETYRQDVLIIRTLSE